MLGRLGLGWGGGHVGCMFWLRVGESVDLGYRVRMGVVSGFMIFGVGCGRSGSVACISPK